MLRKGLFALVIASFLVPSLANNSFISYSTESNGEINLFERTGDLLIGDYWIEADINFYKNDFVISNTKIRYNDDYIDENSRIDIVLNAGSTYYIKSKMTISFYSGNLTLKVF